MLTEGQPLGYFLKVEENDMTPIRSLTQHSNIEQRCAQKIKDRLGLKTVPKLQRLVRPLSGYSDPQGLQAMEAAGVFRVDPPDYYRGFKNFRGLLADEYQRLWRQMTPDDPGQVILTMRTMDGETDIGFKWDFMGCLTTGERFFAILFALVSPAFQGCGVASLLKADEVALAKEMGCDFIQTFHETDNPHFAAAIIPNLGQGFALQAGIRHSMETGNGFGGYVHLRKHLRPGKGGSAIAIFSDGQKLVSPEENPAIIQAIRQHRNQPNCGLVRVTEIGRSL